MLGGCPRSSPDGRDWEIVTTSIALRVVLEQPNASNICFRMADCRELGVFRLYSSSQMLTDALMGEVLKFPPEGTYTLTMKPVEFKTRNGIMVTYIRPIFAASC